MQRPSIVRTWWWEEPTGTRHGGQLGCTGRGHTSACSLEWNGSWSWTCRTESSSHVPHTSVSPLPSSPLEHSSQCLAFTLLLLQFTHTKWIISPSHACFIRLVTTLHPFLIMDTSLIWEKVNGQGLVNFRCLMDSHFNFPYPQNNKPLSPSKNKSYHGQNLFDIGWMVNF